MIWGAIIIAVLLVGLDIELTRYQLGGNWLIYILALSTVSIGVPIYDNRHVIRAAAVPFLAAMCLGSALAAGSAVMMGGRVGFDAAVRGRKSGVEGKSGG